MQINPSATQMLLDLKADVNAIQDLLVMDSFAAQNVRHKTVFQSDC